MNRSTEADHLEQKQTLRSNVISKARGGSKVLSVRMIIGYSLLIPSLMLYVGFVIYPFLNMLILSLYQSKGLVPVTQYIGLENYAKALADARFWSALRHNVIWSVGTLFIPLLIGFLVAVVLARGNIRGRNIFRFIYFIPVTFSQVVVGIVFIWIYHPRWGVVNTFFTKVGLEGWTRTWLGDPSTALYALIVAASWGLIGLYMVVFLSGIQKIPGELYDAAKVDGTNALQEMRHITLPGLRQEITFMIILSLLISFKVFDIVRVLTSGGPFRQSEVLGYYVFELGFKQFNWGYGSAVSVLLTIIIFTISATTILYRMRRD
jgi:raffinose/stachyose/melibiose transport system permease protein